MKQIGKLTVMLLLAISCATRHIELALIEEGILLTRWSGYQFPMENLMVEITRSFDLSQRTADQLVAVVVTEGPGAYTALRCGIATANALGLALSIPVVGVSSLYALAWQHRYFTGLIVPVLRARRDEVNAAIWGGCLGGLKPILSDFSTDYPTLTTKLSLIEEPFLICGDGAPELYAALHVYCPKCPVIQSSLDLQQISAVGLIEAALFLSLPVFPHYVVPRYSHLPEIGVKKKSRTRINV